MIKQVVNSLSIHSRMNSGAVERSVQLLIQKIINGPPERARLFDLAFYKIQPMDLAQTREQKKTFTRLWRTQPIGTDNSVLHPVSEARQHLHGST